MQTLHQCPECGTLWENGTTCQDDFHQLLFWEAEYPAYYAEVHHYMVLGYHLQHPSIYSPEGLKGAVQLLEDFLSGTSTEEMRRLQKDKVDSGKRKHTITAREGSHGAYAHPVQWTMTARDITTDDVHRYCDNTRAWARSIYDSLKASGNLVQLPPR